MSTLRQIGLGIAALVVSAGSIQAAPYTYGELLLGDGAYRVTRTADFSDVDTSWTNPVAGGLGSGLVTEFAPLEYIHTFAPTVNLYDINSISLKVAIVDDELLSLDGLFWNEEADIQVAQDGSFNPDEDQILMLHLFKGAITVSAIQNAGDQLNIKVTAANVNNRKLDDFKVLASQLKVRFNGGVTEPGTTPPIPEPSAAIVFGLGALLAAGALRKRLAN